MMKADKISNPCIRCGKPRIDISVTSELVHGSLAVTTITACPDSECQKRLEEQFEKERKRREDLKNYSKHTSGFSRRNTKVKVA